MPLELHNLREDYTTGALDLASAADDPFRQFEEWFKAAQAADIPEPNAMTLSTATPDGRPSARVVLLKDFSPGGFTFYTNYESRKGKELAANPRAALSFCWLPLQRQIQIEGSVERVAEETSTDYFQSRPLGSQLGAWASPQSEVIADRSVLDERLAEVEEKFAGRDKLPRPSNWGGFVVRAERIEFWQGRSNRLHDRILYTLQADGLWRKQRLAP